MEMTWVDFGLLTLFNGAVCIFLPRIITLNWTQLFSKEHISKSK